MEMTTEKMEIWKRLNKCKCVKKVFGWWVVGDKLWDDYGEEYGCIIGNQETEFTGGKIEITARAEYFSGLQSNIRRDSIEKYWIPPIYDPIRPERSLWGIADKMNVWADLYSACNNGRPDLALAKAIIEQEGT